MKKMNAEDYYKSYIELKKTVLMARIKYAANLCHRALEMTNEEWIIENFASYVTAVERLGKKIVTARLQKILVREFNSLNWDLEDNLDEIWLPNLVVKSSTEVADEYENE